MENSQSLTLFLADEHAIVREGIAASCHTRPGLSIAGECCDGAEALNSILSTAPDIAVLDLNLPKLSALEVTRNLRQAQSPTKVIILSTSREENVIRELFLAGANAYILKDGPAGEIFEAIDRVRDGGTYLTAILDRGTARATEESRDPVQILSSREYEVFSCLVRGMRPKDIAKALSISPKTVDTYRANIMRKLKIDGIAGLVRFAIERNLSTTTVHY
jgi:DNA-binding NarL/FixJ family response regulator